MDEITPIFQELAQRPLAFMGGFVSGLLRLNLADEPVKSWLDQQSGGSFSTGTDNTRHNGKSGPQSISID
jgi:hypothetical protein